MPEYTQGYMDLIAWQKACDLAELVHVITREFPAEERYGLTSQMRSAATSVPGNIAEGAERWGRNEFAHHLSIALGSLAELRTYIELSRRFHYLTDDQFRELANLTSEVHRLTCGLRKSLKVQPAP